MGIESLETRVHLSASMIKDVNTHGSIQVSPAPLTRVGNLAYFAGNDGVNGLELWKTDGTTAGTELVKDVFPGGVGSAPALITNARGVGYFVADDGEHGRELWRTDGTAGGTALVKDIGPGPTSAGPIQLTAVGSTLYFFANDGIHGYELWRSDGTEAGTEMVVDLRPGTGGQSPKAMVATTQGTLFFDGFDSASAARLWMTDGTAAGTKAVTTFAIQRLYAAGPRVFYSQGGADLYAVDGSTGATSMLFSGVVSSQEVREWLVGGDATVYFTYGQITTSLCRLAPGAMQVQVIKEAGTAAAFTDASDLAVLDDGSFYFVATGTGIGREVHRAEPGSTSASVVKDLSGGTGTLSPDNLVAVGNSVYFTTGAVGSGFSVWETDGTAAGTAEVGAIGMGIVAPSNPLALGATFLFVHDDGVNGRELWRSDGTAEGTGLLKAVYPGTVSSSPWFIGRVGGGMLFQVTDGASEGGSSELNLWRTDGTAEGTALVYDAWPGDTYNPRDWRVAGDRAYFTAGTPATGLELWVTDGTTAGTRMVKDINPGAGGSSPTSFSAALGGWTYFVANDGVHGNEIWRTDGTAEGTAMVLDLRPGSAAGATTYQSPVVMDGVAYFLVNSTNGSILRELWRTDGTAEGTSLVYAMPTAATDPYIQPNMIAAGRTLYFARGSELWKSDGTTAGTVRVKAINTSSARPEYFTSMGGLVYFAAAGGLWRSDGTEAGTTIVAPVAPFLGMTVMNDQLYFRSYTGRVTGEGPVLWKSDGTAEGTVLFGHVTQLVDTGYPSGLLAVNGRLFFVNNVAKTGGAGAELWVTDGTAEGTRMVQDLNPGVGDGALASLTAFNGSVFFAGNDGVRGYEPYVLGDTFAPRVRSARFEFQAGQAVRVTFSEDVAASVASAEVVLTNPTTGSTVADSSVSRAYDPGTLTASFTFSGLPGGVLPDGDYRLTIRGAGVKDAAGNALEGDFTLDFFVLAGDANRDRAVNFNDLLIVARNYSGTGRTLAEGDFNYDGTVNFNDLLILARHYNTALAAPVPAPVLAAASLGGTVAAVTGASRGASSSSSLLTPAPVAKPAPVAPKKAARISSRRVR